MLPAALLATGLALTGPAPPRQELAPATHEAVDAAVTRGVDYLLTRQDEAGAWRFRDVVYPGSTALVVYALVKSGLEAEHPALRRALARLHALDAGATYDRSLTLLALEAVDPRSYRDWIAELCESLIASQNRAGDWGYPAGGDLSNTQYAALGLRAAAHAGAAVPSEVWGALLEGVLDYRAADGGFGYSRRNRDGNVSMTAAGVGTLAICFERLGAAGESPPPAAEKALREAETWLGEHFEEATGTTRGNWPCYRLYGIERVGAFRRTDELGGRDWYARGATALLAAQLEDGSWGEDPSMTPVDPFDPRAPWLPRGPEVATTTGREEVRTAFALLFLRRASRQPATGEGRAGAPAPKVFGTASADSAVQVRATGQDPLTVWITGWSAAARARCEWPGERGEGPRVARVEVLVDGRVVAHVEGHSTQASATERFAVRHHFDRPGSYALRVRVLALAPPSDSGEQQWLRLESPEFPVEIVDVEPLWMRAQREDRARNLVPSARVRARASSVFAGGEGLPEGVAHPPELAVDKRSLTTWLAATDDERPALRLGFDKGVRADVVLIGGPRSVPFQSGFFARPLTVEVTVNGGRSYVVPMPPDERLKARLVLERPQRIVSLELRLGRRVPGEGHAATGLSEVELQLR